MAIHASKLAALSVLLLLVVLLVHGARVLPDPVASHFSLEGQADGWMSRLQFLVLLGGLTGLVALLAFGLPALIRATPKDLINVPNRDYWLAPEHLAETRRMMADEFAWFAALTGMLLLLLFQRTIAYNLDPESEAMADSLTILIGYLAATGLWTARLFFRFRRPASS